MFSRGFPDFFRSLHAFNKATIPSPPGSGHCQGLFRIHRPQNMEEPWEFLTVPAEIQSSSFGKEKSSDCPEPEKLSEKTEGNNKSKVHLPFTAKGVTRNKESLSECAICNATYDDLRERYHRSLFVFDKIMPLKPIVA